MMKKIRIFRMDIIMVIKSICTTRHTIKVAKHNYVYVTVRCHTQRQEATSMTLVRPSAMDTPEKHI